MIKIIETISKRSVILAGLTLLMVSAGGYFVGNLLPIKPAGSATTPGTCLPVSKGGTGCFDAEFLDKTYPVGAVYISTNATNPGTFMGGAWEAFAHGQTIFGIDSVQTEFDTAEETGGVTSVTLTEAQMPSHRHRGHTYDVDYVLQNYGMAFGTSVQGLAIIPSNGNSPSANRLTSSYTGDNQSHTNLPPYVTVYMWKRVG